MARVSEGKQAFINQKFKDFTADLNRVIAYTLEYNYGDFRFTVYKSTGGRYNFMIPNTDWVDRFGDKFREVAHKHGYSLEYLGAKGLYYITTQTNNRQEYGRSTLYEPEDSSGS